MIPYELRDTVKDLYTAFSKQPYVPAASWTTTKEFTLDPLLNREKNIFELDAVMNYNNTAEFVPTKLGNVLL
jgi:hypothetical protein